MGRHFAGILASIAFTTTVMRGLVEGAGVESTLQSAVISLVCFSLVGYVIGQLAGLIVLDSVRAQGAAEAAKPRWAATTRR